MNCEDPTHSSLSDLKGLDITELSLKTSNDGLKVSVWFIPNRRNSFDRAEVCFLMANSSTLPMVFEKIRKEIESLR